MKKFLLCLVVFLTGFSGLASAQTDVGPEVRLPGYDRIYSQNIVSKGSGLSKATATVAAFLAQNESWKMDFNTLTSTPHRAWGRGIAIDGFNAISASNLAAAGTRFVRDNAVTLNTDPSSLRLLSAEIAGNRGYVKFIQQYQGLDVLFGYVDLRVSMDGRVFMFGSDYDPTISISTVPSLGVEGARSFAAKGIPDAPPADYIQGGTLAVLPLRLNDRIDYRLVYEFKVPVGETELWDTFVDANTGAVLWRRNLISNFAPEGGEPPNPAESTISGRVMVNVALESYLYGSTEVPLPFAYVNIGGREYVTDADGRFTGTLPDGSSPQVVTRLAGPYALVLRADSTGVIKPGRQVVSATPGSELTITWSDANSTASERSAFYHVTKVRNWIRAIDPSATLDRLDQQVVTNVNINQQCNAFWSPQLKTLNFFKASATCGNTAEIADVVYHEFGHGINTFLYTKLRGSDMANGTIGEATADINANLIRDNPKIGIGFQIGQPNEGIIRNSDNTYRYPEDLFGEIHNDGMILTGAVWELRKAIGLDATAHLAHYAKYGTPDGPVLGEAFADYFIEMLVADDDDGNLANGTPHSDAIITAFRNHGIPGSAISIYHINIADQKSVDTPYLVQGAAYIGGLIDPKDMQITNVKAVYSTDNWQTSQEAVGTYDLPNTRYSVYIPPQKAGTIVRYYLQVQDNFGSFAKFPQSAPKASFVFLVGYDSKFFYDCEQPDGWKRYGDAATGQWVRAKPVGSYDAASGTPPDVPYVQTNEDHTPGVGKDLCWVTGNAPVGAQLGENDVDEGETVLATRTYDVSTMADPILRYYRWFTNNMGASPNQDPWVVNVSSDAGATWIPIENTLESYLGWMPIIIHIKDFVALTDQFQVQFVASDNDPQSLVEAAVDDFEILDIDKSLVNVEKTDAAAVGFDLEQNWPNPFNPTTTIRYSIPSRSEVRLTVYSPLGEAVATLVSGSQDQGSYTATFDAAKFGSGTYMYELVTGSGRLVKSMTLMK